MTYKEQLEEAQKVGGTELLSPEYFAFEKKGDSIIGMLKGFSEVQGSIGEGMYNQYLFDTDGGLIKCAFGAATDREAASQMAVNEVYHIVFQGKVKIKGNRSINKFKIVHIISDALASSEKKDEVPF